MRTDIRSLTAALVAGVVLAAGIAAPAGAAPPLRDRGDCAAGTLDPTSLRQAISGLPDAEATSAQLRVVTATGCWTGAAGVRDLHSRAPIPPDARFRIGSVTKVFTAVVVLQLAAEGQLGLDDPVRDHLPGLLPADWPVVTVRQLLDHTSGLPSPDLIDPDGPLAHRYDRWTAEQLVRAGLPKGPEFPPGTRQHYTNIGYIVAGMLIEQVTGHPYAAEMRDRIFRPLGLKDTYAPGADLRIHGPHVHGYQQVDRDGRVELVDVTTWDQTVTPAAGDLISTVRDLDAFTGALFAGRLLPPDQQRELFTLPAGVPDAAYSIGLTAFPLGDGRTIWFKSGARYGYTAAVAGTADGRFRLAYSVTATDAKGEGQTQVSQRILGAALGLL